MTDNDNEIFHYGVKGMRWGKRKNAPSTTTGKSKQKKAPDSVKSLSDADLRMKINRIQMERQYKSLTERPTLLSTGRKAAQDILVNAAKQTAASYVSKAMTKGVEAALKAAKK